MALLVAGVAAHWYLALPQPTVRQASIAGLTVHNLTASLTKVAEAVVVFSEYKVLTATSLLLIVVGYFVWLKAQYKYQVHLKVLKHGTFTIWHDTARTIKRNGEHYWRLRKLKELASVPPPESIHQGMKGAWEVEGYYERNIGVIWSRDKLSRQEFEALAQSLQERRLKDPSTANVIDTQYQPITSQERALQTAEITKAAL